MIITSHWNGPLLPSLLTDRATLSALVVGQILAVIIAFSPLNILSIWQNLAFISLFIHCVMLLSLAQLYAMRKFLTSDKLIPQLFIILLVFCSTTFIGSIIAHKVISISLINEIEFAARNTLISSLLTLLYIQFSIMHTEQNRAEVAIAKAQLDALQSRIRPHFLFNSLNTAAELIHHNANEAENTILALAKLSRAAMHSGEDSTLEDELVLVKNYVSIEHWRLGKRLDVDWQVPQNIPDCMVPRLTLQPLIENAICHGIEPLEHGGKIEVALHITNQSMTFLVTNPYQRSASMKRASNGIALDNIRRRLNLVYGERSSLTEYKGENTFKVKLIIPRRERKL